jgi:hypothetical protein
VVSRSSSRCWHGCGDPRRQAGELIFSDEGLRTAFKSAFSRVKVSSSPRTAGAILHITSRGGPRRVAVFLGAAFPAYASTLEEAKCMSSRARTLLTSSMTNRTSPRKNLAVLSRGSSILPVYRRPDSQEVPQRFAAYPSSESRRPAGSMCI